MTSDIDQQNTEVEHPSMFCNFVELLFCIYSYTSSSDISLPNQINQFFIHSILNSNHLWQLSQAIYSEEKQFRPPATAVQRHHHHPRLLCLFYLSCLLCLSRQLSLLCLLRFIKCCKNRLRVHQTHEKALLSKWTNL